jgi:predicted aspartyl protease
MPVEVAPTGTAPPPKAAMEGAGANWEESVRSKILSHFIKGKISLTPMETMMMIPGELEHLESLVKVARKKKDAEAASNLVSMVSAAPTLRRLCINKTHRSKTLHLSVEVNNNLVEGLVDIGASMSIMAAAVVRELGLMHLVSGSKTYKTTSGAITQALGRIDEVPIKVGGIQCTMTFMVVDTDSYDVLLGLNLLIKIGAIVDVEQGLIQMRRSPRSDVEVLPLTMVNMLQRSNSETMIQDDADALKHAPGNLNAVIRQLSLYEHGTNERMDTQEFDSDSDTNEDCNEGIQLVGPVHDESEFGNTELEDLVLSEGPQQILQLTL